MRGVLWRRAERALDDGGDLIVIDCPRSARTGLVQQPFDAVLQKASTPLREPDGAQAVTQSLHVVYSAFYAQAVASAWNCR